MKQYSEINAPMTDIAEVMTYLRVSSTEMGLPLKFDKVKYIAEFVKPLANKERFFQRLGKAGQPGVDKLDFFYEYCQQRSAYEHAVSSRGELEKQWLLTGEEGLLGEIDQMTSEIREIEDVISVYEA